MSFIDEMKKKHASIEDAIFHHPFVRGIGDGSLPVDNFKFYMKQDYVYLIDYTHIFSIAVTRTPDLDIKGKFAELLDVTLNTEMALHRSYAEEFGITNEEMEATEPAPTTRAYVNYLLRVAYEGSLAEILASLLPCQLGYAEIGKDLAGKGKPEKQPLYGKWIDTYSSEEFCALAYWLKDLCDELAEDSGKKELKRMDTHYLMAARYEYMFWEMSYRLEKWPI